MQDSIWVRASCSLCTDKTPILFGPERLSEFGLCAQDVRKRSNRFDTFRRKLKCDQCGSKAHVVAEVLDFSRRSDPACRSSAQASPAVQATPVKRRKKARPAGTGRLPPPSPGDIERFRRQSMKTAKPRYDEFGVVEAPEFGTREEFKKDRARNNT